ncbi:MAG: hypothetical protein KGJ62_13485 [Armatimonadetes bacterium]|nr:hypothetical protein [Armatimonadota bacterium]MDE2207458.1 hypothetical protein [Armatimonadota bacterium]
MNAASLPALWSDCVERIKDRVSNRSLWEALESAHPITISGELLVVGLDPMNSSRISHIQQASLRNVIQGAVTEVFGHPLTLKVIEGTTLSDWDLTQQREERIATMQRAEGVSSIRSRVAENSWEAVGDALAEAYTNSPLRHLPQGKARYANEAVYAIVDALATLYSDDPDENAERGYARLLERVSSNADIPASVLAFEVERLRAWQQQPPTSEAESEPDKPAAEA